MENTTPTASNEEKKTQVHPAAPSGAAYGLGFIGSAIYYVQAASGFGGAVVGILKALVWPAFLTYEVLRFIGA